MWSAQIKAVDWGFLTLVAIVSFFFSGLPYYPFLNSDIAVHVLMTESFSFQYDLYYWGQDRLGSLLPMMANIIYRLTHLSPFWIVAIVKWVFLSVGCTAFWYFIPNRAQRWLWTILWFFPAYEMMYHLLPGHPYTEQMALIGISLILFDQWIHGADHWRLLMTIVFAVLAIWVSDFSILFYLVLFSTYYRSILIRLMDLINKRQPSTILSLSAVLLLSFAFLVYAKLVAARDATYMTSMFADVNQLHHSVSLIWFYTSNTLFFKSVTAWNSIFFYATLLLCVLVIVRPHLFKRTRFTRYFLWSSVIGFLLILSLRWLAINHVMLKYFIPVFFCFWLTLFSLNWNSNKLHIKWLSIFLGTLIVIGCASSLVTLYKSDSEQRISYQDLTSTFFQTKKSIIGDYWHSYVFAIAAPGKMYTTPHDQSSVRSPKLVAQVMDADTIYVCLNNWFEKAPQHLTQFDIEMELIEPEIKEGNFRFAAYLKSRNN